MLLDEERESILSRNLFNYRFSTGARLDGCSFGNLFLAALADVTGIASASFEEDSRVLSVTARVLTMTPGDLYASVTPNSRIRDISAATMTSGKTRVFVGNLMTMPGESDGFEVPDLPSTLMEYLGGAQIQYLVVNYAPLPERLVNRRRGMGRRPVELDTDECRGVPLAAVSVKRASEDMGPPRSAYPGAPSFGMRRR